MPNLIAYDICGVQPMTGPTGLIFAMRARYANQVGTEAFYTEANTGFATLAGTGGTIGGESKSSNATYNIPGTTAQTTVLANSNIYNYNQAMTTAQALLYRDWETDRKSTRLNSSHRL